MFLDHHGDENITAASGISPIIWASFCEDLYGVLYRCAGLVPVPLGSGRDFLTSVIAKSLRSLYFSLLNPLLWLLELSGVCS